jgi:hypothetical protein
MKPPASPTRASLRLNQTERAKGYATRKSRRKNAGATNA